MNGFFGSVGLRGVVALGFYAGLACSGWALSPPPGGFKERPVNYQEIWNRAEVVVYGRVVRLELKENAGDRGDYEVAIKVERTWKGEVGGAIVLGETFPGSMPGYLFEFDRMYVVFARKDGKGTYRREHAVAMWLPSQQGNTLGAIFGSPVGERDVLAAFLEAKAGDSAALAGYERLRGQWEESLRMKERETQLALEKEKAEREAPLKDAKAELKVALEEKGVAERKVLLEVLDKKLAGKYDAEFQELRRVVEGELSLVETYLKNGLRRFQ